MRLTEDHEDYTARCKFLLLMKCPCCLVSIWPTSICAWKKCLGLTTGLDQSVYSLWVTFCSYLQSTVHLCLIN